MGVARHGVAKQACKTKADPSSSHSQAHTTIDHSDWYLGTANVPGVVLSILEAPSRSVS
jgi:hypothetical protein